MFCVTCFLKSKARGNADPDAVGLTQDWRLCVSNKLQGGDDDNGGGGDSLEHDPVLQTTLIIEQQDQIFM